MLAGDSLPDPPFAAARDEETPEQEQARLRFELHTGQTYTLFRDKSLDAMGADPAQETPP